MDQMCELTCASTFSRTYSHCGFIETDVTLRRPGFFSFCTAKAEVQLPSSYPVRVELNVRDLSRRDDDSVSNVPVDVGGIVVDVNVLGEEDIDEQLRVMVDFDFGAIKLWQVGAVTTGNECNQLKCNCRHRFFELVKKSSAGE